MSPSRPSKGRAWAALSLAAALLLLNPRPSWGEEELYTSAGIRPEAVRQGQLGSCYFHAVVAAIAGSRPDALKKMIQPGSDGTFGVQFADGKKETAYPEDLRYTREIGYDLSDGLWVAVLFRAYAQRVLREALIEAVDKSDLFPLVKQYARDFVATNDPLLLAYDRAIRSQVDQYGNIDRVKLERRLKDEMAPIPVAEDIKNSLVSLLESGGFFDAVAATIKQNGELFGAYRAVGQGGIAERVMNTLAGGVRVAPNESVAKAGAALAEATDAHLPLVACTGGSQFYQQLAAGQKLPSESEAWYVNAHCYTVLSYDAGAQRIRLRNPWARFPDPDGVFELPLSTFVPAFRGLITSVSP